ncbi:MAG: secondary thiamine-phosphate synthase enzyme YjbQ [Smithellaceae bacterium]|jgi:secondary thiamine-phosphate synthase enzyme
MKEINVRTNSRTEMIDITSLVQAAVEERKVKSGICVIFTPHTTAAVTINENADPDVPIDIISALERAFPQTANYRHAEGNSPAHAKSSLVGASELVLIEDGRIVLGVWQSIFFCEFDGPRSRKIFLSIISGD